MFEVVSLGDGFKLFALTWRGQHGWYCTQVGLSELMILDASPAGVGDTRTMLSDRNERQESAVYFSLRG